MQHITRLTLALACAIVSIPAARADQAWLAATEYPATSMPGEGLARFAHLVDDATHGTLKITIGYDGPNGLTSATIFQAAQSNRLAIADAFAGALSSVDPLFQISSLPFLATTIEQARDLAQIARPAYEAAFAKHDQILLYTTPWPASGLWTRKPITTQADINGLAIRTYDATSTTVLRNASANSVELTFADAMPRLKAGTIDAVLSSGDGGAGRKLWEYLPNFTAIGYAMPLSFATISKPAFDTLDATTQSAILAAGRETEALQWHELETRTAKNLAVMRANNVAIHTPDPDLAAVLATAAQQTKAEWEKTAGPEATRILSDYQNRAQTK